METGKAPPQVAPVTALSRLEVIPDTFPVWYATEEQQLAVLRAAGLYTPVRQPDGTYAVKVLRDYLFRVLPDLYTVSSTSSFVYRYYDAAQAGGKLTVNLKQPLATVPNGTEVSYITTKRPNVIQKIFVLAPTTSAPVFGPGDDTIAIWYETENNTLMLSRPTAGETAHEVSANTEILTDHFPNGQPPVAAVRPPTLRPLVQITGRVCNVDGTPSRLRVITAIYTGNDGKSVTTSVDIDPDGKFSLKNVPAGTLFLYPGSGSYAFMVNPTAELTNKLTQNAADIMATEESLASAEAAGNNEQVPILRAQLQVLQDQRLAWETQVAAIEKRRKMLEQQYEAIKAQLDTMMASGVILASTSVKLNAQALNISKELAAMGYTDMGIPSAGWTLTVPDTGMADVRLNITATPWTISVPDMLFVGG
jgi:hypothetical protein